MPLQTPPTKRTTRGNSQSEVTIDVLKSMFETFKNDIIASLKQEIESLKATVSSLASRVCKLESENIELITKYNEVKNCDTGKDLSMICDELRERDIRKNNIMISGLLEPTSGSVAERALEDLQKCKDVFRTIGKSEISIERVSRIGRPRNDNKRLLRVVLMDPKQRIEVLRESKLLRESPLYSRLYVKADLTRLEREVQFRLRKEVRERKMNGEDVIISRGKVVIRNTMGFREMF